MIILHFFRFSEEVSLKLFQNWTRGDPSIGNLELYFGGVLIQMIRRHDSQIQEVSRIGYRENKETISLWIFCIRTQRLSANEWWAMRSLVQCLRSADSIAQFTRYLA